MERRRKKRKQRREKRLNDGHSASKIVRSVDPIFTFQDSTTKQDIGFNMTNNNWEIRSKDRARKERNEGI